MSGPIDTSTEFGQRLQKSLSAQETIWLTTVNSAGVPNPSIVWFLWEDDSIYILSQPHQIKVKSIAANPQVALHFDSDGHGGIMQVINGTATLLEPATVETVPATYFSKYEQGLKGLGYSHQDMVTGYSQPIRITIDKVRGH